MSFKVEQKKNRDHHLTTSFASKTRAVAKSSKSFFLYPKILTCLLVFTLAMVTVRVYYSNQLAVSGSRVSLFQSKEESLTQDNYQIENEISQKSSLSYIDQKAQQMGLVKVDKVEVVEPLTPVAFKP